MFLIFLLDLRVENAADLKLLQENNLTAQSNLILTRKLIKFLLNGQGSAGTPKCYD